MAEVFYGAYRAHGSLDYNCGFKYYPGHAGTDILLRDFTAQDSGVAVLAAAPGRVTQIVDGMFDRNTTIAGGGFGNHVVLLHEEHGVVSIYAHLRNGSVRVGLNARVARGDTLGLVGSSGNSNWPHLHFEVRNQSSVEDPFLGPCNPPATQVTWLAQLPYQNEFRVLDAGLTTRSAVTYADLLERLPDEHVVTPESEAFSVRLSLYNVRAAEIRSELQDAGGTVLAQWVSFSVRTYSTVFFRVEFDTRWLGSAGPHAVVLHMQPEGSGAEIEIHRQEFDFEPGPAGIAALRAPSEPRGWIGPDGGDRQ